MDIISGTIFTDRHIPETQSNILSTVFMPLSLMDEKTRKEWIATDPGMIYEYLSAAGPRAINGFPTFFSLRTLTQEETKRVFVYIDRIKESVEKL